MDRSRATLALACVVVLFAGGALEAWCQADDVGLIAFVEQTGRGSGEGRESFLYIPRGGENPQDQWDRFTFDIYTIRPDGSDRRRMTTDGTSIRPQWSWDGDWIAYVTGPKPIENLYVVRADGSNRRALLERELSIERFWWSFDGRKLLVAVASRQSSSNRPTRRGVNRLEGYIVDVRTGRTSRLSNSDWMRGWNHWEPGTDDVVNPRSRLLAVLGENDWPLWSPNAEFIAFVHDGFLALAHAPSVSGNGNWFLWKDEPRASRVVEWSRDGRRVLFHPSRGDRGMLVAELDAKRYRWGDVYLVTTRQGGGGTFNGDGSRIAFLSTPPGRMNNEIYVVDVSGENEERITQSRVNHSQLTWQPVSDPAD